jgi:hypothetical protein
MNLNANYKVFSTPKAGNSETEYEDAFYPHEKPALTYRFAIADGATESSFAKIWADLLTKGFVNKNQRLPVLLNSPGGFSKWLKTYREKWDHQITWDKLSFFAKEKAKEGAYCTFLGLELFADSWRAWATGDCELFQIRDNQLIYWWPIKEKSEFGTSPDLICSIEHNTDNRRHNLLSTGLQRYKGNDIFILTTDAMAAWLLSQDHENNRTWESISKISTNKEFAELINDQRQNKLMRNDDTTLMYIKTIVAWF